jgi:D-xylose transport system ATP-binding protein
VLRLGRNGGDFRVAETSQEEVVAAITGLTSSGAGRRAGLPAIQPASREGADAQGQDIEDIDEQARTTP